MPKLLSTANSVPKRTGNRTPTPLQRPPRPDLAEVGAALEASLARAGGDPDTALEHLIELQRQFSHVPEQGIALLAQALGVGRAQILAAVDFYAFLHRLPRGIFDILFSDNITDRMAGNPALMRQLCDLLDVRPGEPRADGRLSIDTTSCTGMCDQGPALLVNGLAITGLTPERIHRIGALVDGGVPVADWPRDLFVVSNSIRRGGLLLGDTACPDAGLSVLLEEGAEAVLADIERSGLRGRGGAGFATALKWRFCREAEHPSRVVVCNADEGEPGTFKDRVLLTACADSVVQGMTLCAGVVGASLGFIYLRGEYRYLLGQLEAVLQRRRDLGLLGRNILGSEGFDFDIRIRLGAGAYICGEESALIESLEGKRGITRKRPPFPVVKGFLDRPTVVNNVETFLAVARIAEHGAQWFRGEGTLESAGSKILSVSGDCARPGIYEYPFGTRVSRVLADSGATDTQAVQVSGAAGTTLSVDGFERSLAFEDLSTGGSFMIFDQGRDLFEMVRNFAAFFAHESCGFCTPCRVGSTLLENLVEKLAAGRGSEHDLDQLRQLGEVMRRGSHCGLGHTAPNHVFDTLERFPHIYRDRLARKGSASAFDPAFHPTVVPGEARPPSAGADSSGQGRSMGSGS